MKEKNVIKHNTRSILTLTIILVFITFAANYHYLTEYLPHRSEFKSESAVISKRVGGGHGWGYMNSYQVEAGPEGTYAYVNCSFWEHTGDTILVAVPDGTKHYLKTEEGAGSSYYKYPVQRTAPVVTTGMGVFAAALLISIALHCFRPDQQVV